MDFEFSKLARRIIDAFAGMWATEVFVGVIIGTCMEFVVAVAYLDVYRNIPHHLFLGVGVGIRMLYRWVRGKPLIRDGNREQLEIFEGILEKLPEPQRRELYQRAAERMCEDLQFEVPRPISLQEYADQALHEAGRGDKKDDGLT